MDNKKETKDNELKKDDCVELTEEELKGVAGGKVRPPEQREVN